MKIIRPKRVNLSSEQISKIKYLELLKTDQYLNQFLAESRAKLGLPKNGLKYSKQSLNRIMRLSDERFDQILIAGRAFTLTYRLPLYWTFTGMMLIAFNVGIVPQKEFYAPIELKLEEDGFGNELHIIIREHTSPSAIKNFLLQYKREFYRQMSSLTFTPTVKLQNIKDRLRIIKLHQSGKSDTRIIGSLLSNLDPSDVGKKRRETARIIDKIFARKSLMQLLATLTIPET